MKNNYNPVLHKQKNHSPWAYKISPPSSLILYTQIQLFFHKNSLFMTFIKNICQWGMNINSPRSLLGQKIINPLPVLIKGPLLKENMWEVKTPYIPGAFWIINNDVKVCKGTTNTSYTWGCYHIAINHTIYVRRGTTPLYISYFKSRTNKAGSTPVETRTSRKQRPMNDKRNKREWMNNNLHKKICGTTVKQEGISPLYPKCKRVCGWHHIFVQSSSIKTYPPPPI